MTGPEMTRLTNTERVQIGRIVALNTPHRAAHAIAAVERILAARIAAARADERDALAEILAEHWWAGSPKTYDWRCQCGETMPMTDEGHQRHIADLLAAHIAAARADERRRVAEKLEASAADHRELATLNPSNDTHVLIAQTFEQAARMARRPPPNAGTQDG